MPYEKTVRERQTWWCWKWYFPLWRCSGIRTQHKWCYNFAWVEGFDYVFVAVVKGCENGKLYSWTKGVFWFGSFQYPAGELCFDDSLGEDEGICDPSRTGLLASGLASDKPYASAISLDYADLEETSAESGEFDFSGKYQSRCQKGVWRWQRTLHKNEVTATVTKHLTDVKWQVGGVDLTAGSGTVAVGAQCWWPFPLPDGRKEYREVQLAYTVAEDSGKSVLQLRNDPKDGCFELSVSMAAMQGARQIASSVAYASFTGETCDFDEDKVAAQMACFGQRLKELLQIRQLPEKPGPTDPVVVFSDEAWRLAARDRRGTIRPLLDIMSISAPDDPQELNSGLAQLQREFGTADMTRMVAIRPAAEVMAASGGCQACQGIRAGLVVAAILAAGIIVGRLLI